MAPRLQIVTGSTVPIYRQLVDQVRQAVARGELVEGDRLPSIRELAERLVLNPNTIARAFGELARDRVIESQPGRGMFVASSRQVLSPAERRRRLEEAMDAFISHLTPLGFEPGEVLSLVAKRMDRTLGASAASSKEEHP